MTQVASSTHVSRVLNVAGQFVTVICTARTLLLRGVAFVLGATLSVAIQRIVVTSLYTAVQSSWWPQLLLARCQLGSKADDEPLVQPVISPAIRWGLGPASRLVLVLDLVSGHPGTKAQVCYGQLVLFAQQTDIIRVAVLLLSAG